MTIPCNVLILSFQKLSWFTGTATLKFVSVVDLEVVKLFFFYIGFGLVMLINAFFHCV